MPTGLQIRHTSANNLQCILGAYAGDVKNKKMGSEQYMILPEAFLFIYLFLSHKVCVLSHCSRSVQYNNAIACQQEFITYSVNRQLAVSIKKSC